MNAIGQGEIRIAIAGLGLAGSAIVSALVQHPAFQIAGAAEPNETLRERFFGDFGCATYASVNELVHHGDFDAIYIATPHQFHREHTLLAARAGKHVLVEKPMALTLEDCDAMIEACDRAHVRLVVGHTHSFDPGVQAMREMIASGRMGRVSMLLMFNYTDFLYRPRRAEELDTSKGGGVIYNQVPHQVDIARYLIGENVSTVLAQSNMLDRSRPTEGGVMAMLQFVGGASASLVYSGYDRFDSDELHGWVGEGGRVKLPAHGSARNSLVDRSVEGAETAMRADLFGYGGKAWVGRAAVEKPLKQPHFGTIIVSCERGDLRMTPDGIVVYGDSGAEEICLPSPRKGAGRAEVLDEFAAAVRGEKEATRNGRFARGTVETCLAILRSTQTRLPVHLGEALPDGRGKRGETF